MLRLDRTGRSLTRLETQPLASAQISERYDLQDFIVRSPEAFFAELGEKILLIASEVRPSDDVDDRIDLLGVDAEGNAVIVELKRGNDKFQLFQAISYAAMIASWEPHDFEAEMEEKTSRARLSDFLNNGRDSLNRGQRIILVAEAFDYSVLIGAEWLSERYGVNIRCCQLSLAIDSTGGRSEYLVCTNIFPAPEIAEQAVRRGRQRGRSTGLKWDDWPSLLDSLPNPVVADFFRSELAQQRESALSKEELRYRIDGTRRWNVHARAKAAHAYVWQLGRFEGDLEFWRQLLSRPDDVGSVKGGRALSFALETAADFSYFEKAVKHDLAAVAWLPQQADVDESEKP